MIVLREETCGHTHVQTRAQMRFNIMRYSAQLVKQCGLPPQTGNEKQRVQQ